MEASGAKILVVFSKADLTHRHMLEGILKYAREKCGSAWEVQLDLRDISRRNTDELTNGGFSGIIAAIVDARDRAHYFATGLPTVFFEPTLARMDPVRRPANNVTFFNDHAAEGRAAAEYYLARGYRSFAYVPAARPEAWCAARGRGFAARLSKNGFKPHVYAPAKDTGRADFTAEAPHLAKWLRRLPKPTAVFTAHDERALQVLSAARRAGLAIPEHIALLGVDDDELLCTTASTPLSSIPVAATETGWNIAQRMDELLHGRNPTPIVRTCHARIITRRSTDAFWLDDPIVSKAVAYISKHLDASFGTEELAAAANCSPRTLQTKMLASLHRTPREEIALVRQTEAVKLLRETSLPIAEVARRCGFCSATHLGTQLKKSFGRKPLQIRRDRGPLG